MTSASSPRGTPAGARKPAPATSPFAPAYRSVMIGMLTLIALNAFESLAVTTTMPAVVDALGGLSLYAMAFAAPVASGIVGMVAAGGWADRRGPARPLLTGVGLFVVGLVIAGTATGMGTVVTGRLVQGLGSGLISVALYVLVARVFPDHVQPRVFAAFAAAWVVPSVVGPALAGLIAEHLGWRWVFLAIPLLTVPALLALRPALAQAAAHDADADAADADTTAAPATPAISEHRRIARALGAGAGAMALHWGGEQGGGVGLAVVGLGLVLLGATVPHLFPPGTLRVARGLPAVIVLRGLVAAAFFGAEVYLPLLFITQRGLRPAQAGLALTVAAICWSTGSWLRGRNEGRWHDATVLRAGSVAVAAGIALAALAVSSAVPVAISLVGWGVAGLGMGLCYPTLSLLTLRLSTRADQGSNSSALQVNESLTVAVVLAVSGPLFAALVTTHPTAAFLACFVLAAALATAAAALAGRVSPRP
ncbi:MFS transporter [Cellulomonas sp. KRMCY2]|uniref:MFS transporter n=1 Tax=Cellulomonas sp. KRMCY2 TaxID=1304865 RepID=UPI0004A28CEB|nr:MFS transporter [Cellulomonas sp. KRMCY2]